MTQHPDDCVGVLGASSFVGARLLALLDQQGLHTVAFTRKSVTRPGIREGCVEWHTLPTSASLWAQPQTHIRYWICLAPIAALPHYFPMLEVYGVRRIVVLSTTSLHTKQDTTDATEQVFVQNIRRAEADLESWAQAKAVDWVVLRPTLVYDFGRDANLTEIARFIRRFGFFPTLGKAEGLRQPVHAEDVAAACVAALLKGNLGSRSYNISGGEILAYREMVSRIFTAMDSPARMLSIPLWAFRLGVAALRLFPRYRHWNIAMAERMNRDMVFDHADASRDLGFSPRPFVLTSEDVSPC